MKRFAHAVSVYVYILSLVVPLVSSLPPPLQGLQGDMVLVVGVNTSTPKVQVRLRERAWQGVEPDIIVIEQRGGRIRITCASVINNPRLTASN